MSLPDDVAGHQRYAPIMTARDIAVRFNDAINARDLEALVSLMTEEHRFIDPAAQTFEGKARCREIWQQFFAAFPDYHNHFESVTETGETVVVIGHSTCSDPRLAGRALWTAKVHDGRVAEWRVYDDTPDSRATLAIS
jgi:ketosteroid isomerase-like protein